MRNLVVGILIASGVAVFVWGASSFRVSPGRSAFETGPSIGLQTRVDRHAVAIGAGLTVAGALLRRRSG